jgi:TrkA-C domain
MGMVLATVEAVTLGVTLAAVCLAVGEPPPHSTMPVDRERHGSPPAVFAPFQRDAIGSNVQRLRRLAEHGTVMTVEVARASPYAGTPVARVPWPANAFIMTMVRGADAIVPLSTAVLQAHDRVSMLVEPGTEAAAMAALGAGEGAGP